MRVIILSCYICEPFAKQQQVTKIHMQMNLKTCLCRLEGGSPRKDLLKGRTLTSIPCPIEGETHSLVPVAVHDWKGVTWGWCIPRTVGTFHSIELGFRPCLWEEWMWSVWGEGWETRPPSCPHQPSCSRRRHHHHHNPEHFPPKWDQPGHTHLLPNPEDVFWRATDTDEGGTTPHRSFILKPSG